MVKVNIVFDDIFDDADIIAIPDELFLQIEEIGQAFLHWVLTTEDPDYWKLINGRKCIIAETDGFIKWMNTTYCKDLEKCFVVARNTGYDSALKIIGF
jgi:hypothetical protein